MKTETKQTQCQRLLAYLKKHRRGITTMEAFRELGITCVHKRIAEIDGIAEQWVIGRKPTSDDEAKRIIITRHREKTASGATVTRYKLAKP